MIIRSQDGKVLMTGDCGFRIGSTENPEHKIEHHVYVLLPTPNVDHVGDVMIIDRDVHSMGAYSTEEIAIKVLDDLQTALYDKRTLFRFPAASTKIPFD